MPILLNRESYKTLHEVPVSRTAKRPVSINEDLKMVFHTSKKDQKKLEKRKIEIKRLSRMNKMLEEKNVQQSIELERLKKENEQLLELNDQKQPTQEYKIQEYKIQEYKRAAEIEILNKEIERLNEENKRLHQAYIKQREQIEESKGQPEHPLMNLQCNSTCYEHESELRILKPKIERYEKQISKQKQKLDNLHLRELINNYAHWHPLTFHLYKRCPEGINDMRKAIDDKDPEIVFNQLKSIAERQIEKKHITLSFGLFKIPTRFKIRRKEDTVKFYKSFSNAQSCTDVIEKMESHYRFG